MARDKKSQEQDADEKSAVFQGYVVNEEGEEVPITEEMMADSMARIKLKSIGAHTGYTKAITDDMVPEPEHAED